ncbi:MAG TPA: hypothetical protein VGN72_23605 [Tepidisphaeraceae bacterium]|nr:hypothetical protein [Tepidisphaeraceae bacterium]
MPMSFNIGETFSSAVDRPGTPGGGNWASAGAAQSIIPDKAAASSVERVRQDVLYNQFISSFEALGPAVWC